MTELRGISWTRFLRDLVRSQGIRSRSLQWACSEALRQQKYMCIKLDKVGSIIMEYKGFKFYADVPNYFHIFSVYEDYPINLIKPSDIVLDLGANIGAFSIPAAKIAKKVYAVEPITIDLLKRNIELNGLTTNIDVIEEGIGIGSNGNKELDFLGISRICKTTTLEDLLSRIGKVDYIKIDIEGDEWLIRPSEFDGTRVITGEVHLYNKNNSWKQWLDWLSNGGYKVNIHGSWSKEKRFTAVKGAD